MTYDYKRLMKFLFYTVVLCFLFTAAAAGSDPARSYTLATTDWAGWSALDVADELGFWQDEGICVDVVHYESSTVLSDVIISGMADFSCNMVGDVVDKHNAGNPVIILAETNWSNGGDQIISKKDFNFGSYRNGVIGIYSDSPAVWYFLQTYLSTLGLDYADFRSIEIERTALVSQFILGRIPIIIHYEPFASMALREGAGKILATSADFPGIIPECLYVKKSRLDEIPADDVHAVIKGWVMAAEWINDPANWDEYSEILSGRTLAAAGYYTGEELRNFFEAVRIHDRKMLAERNLSDDGVLYYLKDIHDFLEERGLINSWTSYEEIIDTSYLESVLDEMKDTNSTE